MNMPAVTPRQMGGEAIPTCNARELHASLGVGRDFSNWIKDRIADYGFVEGKDYARGVFAKSGEKVGGRPAVEHHLTPAMVKELAIAGATPAETLVAMKPMVEGMGLEWSSPYQQAGVSPAARVVHCH